MTQYQYTKSPVSVDRLTLEISQSTITIALSTIVVFGIQVTVEFKASLSVSEKETLDAIVDSHTGEPLVPPEPEIVIASMPEPKPFAAPDYRTKHDATSSLVTIQPGETKAIDHLLPEERYVSGGCLIVDGAQLGDYISAEIMDTLSIIPAPYRAATCENWPTVATYIIKEWVEATGGVVKHRVDTYPLNAKISQGLCLRITYHASQAGNNRTACVNYYLTKKLV